MEFLRLNDDLLERLKKVVEEARDRIGPPIGPGVRDAVRRLEFEFGMRQTSCGIPVAPVERFISGPQRLDIRLRYRSRSISNGHRGIQGKRLMG